MNEWTKIYYLSMIASAVFAIFILFYVSFKVLYFLDEGVKIEIQYSQKCVPIHI